MELIGTSPQPFSLIFGILMIIGGSRLSNEPSSRSSRAEEVNERWLEDDGHGNSVVIKLRLTTNRLNVCVNA